MIVSVDFDGTLIQDEVLAKGMILKPFAKEALTGMHDHGHMLVLDSTRSNRSLRENWELNPLWLEKPPTWDASQIIHQQRFDDMVDFVNTELPGVFHVIDEGLQGKVVADIYVNDRAIRYGSNIISSSWDRIASQYGEG